MTDKDACPIDGTTVEHNSGSHGPLGHPERQKGKCPTCDAPLERPLGGRWALNKHEARLKGWTPPPAS